MQTTCAKYHLGQVLRHRKHPFRGVVFDVDAMFSNTEDWYENIPEDSRPSKDQPFYHLWPKTTKAITSPMSRNRTSCPMIPVNR
jgi:hemimethylated DNA binding protein